MSRYISSPIIHGPHFSFCYQQCPLYTQIYSISTGSVAHRITGKKPNDSATHRWTVYIRGQDIHDDLSSIVSKVVFSLHPSFDEPIRGWPYTMLGDHFYSLTIRCYLLIQQEVRNQPFEVTESGWGEFEVGIKVFFCEKDEQVRTAVYMGKK